MTNEKLIKEFREKKEWLKKMDSIHLVDATFPDEWFLRVLSDQKKEIIKETREELIKEIERDIIQDYTDWLCKTGYTDSDVYTEEPKAVDRYLKEKS